MTVSVVLIFSQCCGRYRYPFSSAQADLLRSKKTTIFVTIHFEWRFCKAPFLCIFVRTNMNDFTKTEIWICVFVQIRSSVNWAYVLY